MEKSGKDINFGFCKRLLSAFCAFFSALCVCALEVVPKADHAISGTPTVFELELSDVQPSIVEFFYPDFNGKAGITRASKTAFIGENGESGTKIELYVVFYEDGYFQLPNLQVKIEDLHYSVPFAPLQVFKNPEKIQPELFCEFDSGVQGDFSAEAGKPIVFTVFARYFLQTVAFSFEIPENALFRELERFDAVSENHERREFSTEKVPIARFEWVPLLEGSAHLPAVKLAVITYSGSRAELSLENADGLQILPPKNNVNPEIKPESESLFAYAFTPSAEEADESDIAEPVSAEIRVLSRLRDKERRSLPFSNTRTVRQQVESAMGLMPGENEPFVIVPVILWILTAISLFFAIVFLRKKHSAKSFFSFVLLICFCVLASVFTARQLVPYGVFTGGEIYPIPEESAKTSFYIHGGNRVRIVERTPSWIYISFNSIEGWVPSQMVEPIKSTVFEIEK